MLRYAIYFRSLGDGSRNRAFVPEAKLQVRCAQELAERPSDRLELLVRGHDEYLERKRVVPKVLQRTQQQMGSVDVETLLHPVAQREQAGQRRSGSGRCGGQKKSSSIGVSR